MRPGRLLNHWFRLVTKELYDSPFDASVIVVVAEKHRTWGQSGIEPAQTLGNRVIKIYINVHEGELDAISIMRRFREKPRVKNAVAEVAHGPLNNLEGRGVHAAFKGRPAVILSRVRKPFKGIKQVESTVALHGTDQTRGSAAVNPNLSKISRDFSCFSNQLHQLIRFRSVQEHSVFHAPPDRTQVAPSVADRNQVNPCLQQDAMHNRFQENLRSNKIHKL